MQSSARSSLLAPGQLPGLAANVPEEADAIADDLHPAWAVRGWGRGRKLHARNVWQILGPHRADADGKPDRLVCATPRRSSSV